MRLLYNWLRVMVNWFQAIINLCVPRMASLYPVHKFTWFQVPDDGKLVPAGDGKLVPLMVNWFQPPPNTLQSLRYLVPAMVNWFRAIINLCIGNMATMFPAHKFMIEVRRGVRIGSNCRG